MVPYIAVIHDNVSLSTMQSQETRKNVIVELKDIILKLYIAMCSVLEWLHGVGL